LTNLTQPQAAAWLVDTRKRWADMIVKVRITLDGSLALARGRRVRHRSA